MGSYYNVNSVSVGWNYGSTADNGDGTQTVSCVIDFIQDATWGVNVDTSEFTVKSYSNVQGTYHTIHNSGDLGAVSGTVSHTWTGTTTVGHSVIVEAKMTKTSSSHEWTDGPTWHHTGYTEPPPPDTTPPTISISFTGSETSAGSYYTTGDSSAKIKIKIEKI